MKQLVPGWMLLAILATGCSQSNDADDARAVFAKGWFKVAELGDDCGCFLSVVGDRHATVRLRFVNLQADAEVHGVTGKIRYPYEQDFTLSQSADGNIWQSSELPTRADEFLAPAIYQHYEFEIEVVGRQENVVLRIIVHSNPVALISEKDDPAEYVEAHGGTEFPDWYFLLERSERGDYPQEWR